MKPWLFLALLALAVPVKANQVLELFTPTPVAVVLKVGEWLTRDREQVYYIRVEATAPSEAEARTQAFRLAVEQAVGSLLLSETAVQDGEVKRHEIISYSSGYIRDFEVVDVKRGPWGASLVVDVWVAGSKIADRLGVRARSKGDLAGGKIAESLASIQQQNTSGDAVVRAVLSDFPERAWNITSNNVEYFIENRIPVLVIDFSVAWRPGFVQSLEEAMSEVAESTSAEYQGPGVVFDRKPCVFCTNKSYITDQSRGSLLVQNTYWRFPRVLVTVYDKMKRPVLKQCVYYAGLEGIDLYHNLYGNTTYQFKLYTKKVLQNSLRLDLSRSDVSNLDNVELSVVRKSHCPK